MVKMKTIFLLFIPFILFSQIQYPDTVLLQNGRSYNCFIIETAKNSIRIDFSQSPDFKIPLYMIEKAFLDDLGKIYTKDNNYLIGIDSLNSFIEIRQVYIGSGEEYKGKVLSEIPPNKLRTLRFSYALVYVPNYTFLKSSFYDIGNDFYLFVDSKKTDVYESHLAFFLSDNIAIETEFSYKSLNIYDRSLVFNRYDNYPLQNTDQGLKRTYSTQNFSINIGLKYYFKTLSYSKVCPFIFAGIGKQIANVENKVVDLFNQNGFEFDRIEKNVNELLEDLNSPVSLFYGLGMEYAFNRSIALFGIIRIKHSWWQGDFKSRSVVDDYWIRSLINDNRISKVDSHLGIGLNFYADLFF